MFKNKLLYDLSYKAIFNQNEKKIFLFLNTVCYLNSSICLHSLFCDLNLSLFVFNQYIA